MGEAVEAQGGDKASFLRWTDDWLKHAGANTLQAEIDSAGKLNIKQGLSKYGNNVLREQTVDVLVFHTMQTANLLLKNVKVAKAEVTRDIVA